MLRAALLKLSQSKSFAHWVTTNDRTRRMAHRFVPGETLDEAIAFSNRIAPEHLELAVENPFEILPLISNAGAIFMGFGFVDGEGAIAVLLTVLIEVLSRRRKYALKLVEQRTRALWQAQAAAERDVQRVRQQLEERDEQLVALRREAVSVIVRTAGRRASASTTGPISWTLPVM